MHKCTRICYLFLFALPVVAHSDNAAQQAASEEHFRAQKQAACEQIDLTNNLENNPYAFKSEDVGCDLGLEMPGLPSFGGLGFEGLDSCSLLKMVTGDMVDAANTAMRDKVDGIVFEGVQGINDRLGLDSGQGLNYRGGEIGVGEGLADDAKDAVRDLGRDAGQSVR